MVTCQDRLCTRNDDDRLRVVDDHRWTIHDIANLKVTEQKYGGVVNSPNLVEINAVLRLGLDFMVNRLFGKLGDLLVNRLAESVVCFTDATDLLRF